MKTVGLFADGCQFLLTLDSDVSKRNGATACAVQDGRLLECDAHRANMDETPQFSRATIPLMEEDVHVEREVVETGAVRVRVRTSSHTEVINNPLLTRGVNVERVPRGLVVDEPRGAWKDGDVTVMPVYREVMVKRTLLIEELRMSPTVSVQRGTEHVELKLESAVFERRSADGTWEEVSLEELHSR